MMTEQKALWLISKLYPKRHEDEIAREVTRVCVSQERIRRRHRYWDDSRISSELRLRQYDYDVLATARPGGDVARRCPHNDWGYCPDCEARRISGVLAARSPSRREQP